MKQGLILFVVHLFFVFANAQPSQTYRPIYDNLVPVSPSEFQFLKHTEIPVSEYTGIPSISVPIYTVNVDGVSVPISLNYHAGGVRVSEDASWVGLGWDMTFGSVIQMINDQDDYGYSWGELNPKVLPDYYHNAIPGSFAYRWNYFLYCNGTTQGLSWTPTLPVNSPQANFGFMIATDYYAPVNGEFNTRRLELFDYPEYDSEPDIFKANFLGHSINYIKVFTNNYEQFVVLNRKGYVVHRLGTGENYTWKITVPAGEEYYFEEKNIVETFSSTNDFWGSTSSGPYKAASKIWMMTKIITKNKKTILFNYSRTTSQGQYPSFSQKRYKMNLTNSQIVTPSDGDHRIAKIGNGLNCVDCYGQTFIYTKEDILTPSSIVFPGGRVDFTSSSRQDKYGGKKLDLVEVKSSSLVESAQLNYSYFDASGISSPGFTVTDDNINRQRLKLNSITLKNGAVYQFVYNNTSLPKKNSFAQDYWGFYNGNLSNSSMVPNATQFNRPDLFNNGDNHSARLEFAKAAVLEKIIYPTGGNTTFDYSLNQFDNYWIPDYTTSSNTVSSGNGLRVSSIFFSADNNSSQSKKTVYSYEGGKAIFPKDFIRTFIYNTIEFSTCGAFGTGGIQKNDYSITEVNGNGFFSSSMFGSINGVGYSKVTKTDVDNVNQTLGRTETYFHNNPDRIANTSNSATHLSVSLPAIKQYDYNKFENGLVKEVKIFDKTGYQLEQIENLYSNIGAFSQIYYGARIYGYGSYVHQTGIEACDFNCGWGYKAQHMIGYYPIFYFQSLLLQVKTTDYANGESRYVTRNFSYDEYRQVILEDMHMPNNGYETTVYTRTKNASGSTRDLMMGANRLADIWRIEATMNPAVGQPAIQKSKTEVTYKVVGDKYVEDQITVTDRMHTGSVPKFITYDQYDAITGNLKEYTTNNLKTSLIWDYENQYAIAEVKNAAAAYPFGQLHLS